MTPQQILTKAIGKAIANGWEPNDGEHTTADFLNIKPHEWKYAGMKQSIPWLIFDHDFAKALWNTPIFAPAGELYFATRDGKAEWQYHLVQMVVAEDPIAYLGENL